MRIVDPPNSRGQSRHTMYATQFLSNRFPHSFFFGTSTAREDLLACVGSDVRAGLLHGLAGGDAVVPRALREQLTGVIGPEETQFIGRAVRNTPTTRTGNPRPLCGARHSRPNRTPPV